MWRTTYWQRRSEPSHDNWPRPQEHKKRHAPRHPHDAAERQLKTAHRTQERRDDRRGDGLSIDLQEPVDLTLVQRP